MRKLFDGALEGMALGGMLVSLPMGVYDLWIGYWFLLPLWGISFLIYWRGWRRCRAMRRRRVVEAYLALYEACLIALIAQRMEQGSSTPTAAGSSPAERALLN